MGKKGTFPTVKYKGVYLHSPYNPLRETEKILGQFNIKNKSLYILFEPGLGYPVEYILEKNPEARFIIISPLNLLSEKIKKNFKETIWTKNNSQSGESFLLDHIHESDLECLSYIPWPPSLRLLKEEALKWNVLLHKVLTRLSGNHSNIIGFGKKNVRNSLINFLTVSPTRIPQLKGKHVLITAAGPSLSKSLIEIKNKREGYFLIGLPSSAKALVSQNIMADLIISTDGGYWASRHYEHFPPDVPVGIALSGRRDPMGEREVFPLFRQNTYPENSILEEIKLDTLPTSGTVALSAMQFALATGAKSLTLAGLDLCMDDIKSHVAPHSFDSIIEESTQRTGGIQHAYFTRASQMSQRKEGRVRFGYTLSLFREMINHLPKGSELYRLSPGTPELEGWTEIKELIKRPVQSVQWTVIDFPEVSLRRKMIHNCLNQWKQTFIKEIEDDLAFFHSPPNGFSDFIYTLSAENFSTVRKLSFLKDKADYKKELIGFKKEILLYFKKMEELIGKFS
jgi:hypothetical protein